MNDRLRFAVIISAVGELGKLYTTLASLSDQILSEWNLYICSDGLSANTIEFIDKCFEFSVDVNYIESISELMAVEADWVLPLIPGDELTPDGLARFLGMIKGNIRADMIYSDHGEYSSQKEEIVPFFKPGWSPEYLIATDYISRSVIRNSIFTARISTISFDQVNIWDLHLYVSRTDGFVVDRIQRVLISLCSETQASIISLSGRALAVVREHLNSIGVIGSPRWADWAKRLGILSFEVDFPHSGPSISILIPSKNNWEILSRCLDSLENTTYDNYEIIVIDNESDDEDTKSYLQNCRAQVFRIPSPSSGFSYSFINNEAAKAVKTEYILFLNDDTEVIAPHWLSQMAGWLQIRSVASVGARLLFPNNRIQHAGIIHKMLDGVLPGLPYRWMPAGAIGPRGQDRSIKNYSALTAACLLVRTKEFLESGMFDDLDFSIAYNDCDLGFRFAMGGKRNVFEPTAELYHHEGFSRGSGRNNDKISEEIAFINKYRDWEDPYFNENLRLDGNGIISNDKRLPEKDFVDNRISIALFTHNLNYEGAPLVLLEIAEGLVNLCNADVTVFSPQDGALRTRYENIGCNIEILETRSIYQSQTESDFQAAITEVTDRLVLCGADVILANTVLLHWPLVTAHKLNLPTIWLIHESEPPFEHLRPYGAIHVQLAEKAMANASATVFVSNASRALYDGYKKKYQTEVIYNGFDFGLAEKYIKQFEVKEEREKLGISPAEVAVLLPGTICERKAQLDLIAAIQKLDPDTLRTTRYFIVGAVDNEYTTSVRAAVERLPKSVRDKISIVETTQDIYRYFIASDVMVFPSHVESFPRVIQEAMFFGLGIITTDVFGIAEQVIDGKTALCFSPGDTQKLAQHLTDFVKNPDRRIEMGKHAKLSLCRFSSISDMQNAYWELIKRVYHTEVAVQGCVAHGWVRDTSNGRPSWWEDLIKGDNN